MSKRNECENVLKRVIEGVVRNRLTDMHVHVYVSMCGDKDFIVQRSRQTTLSEFMDLGVEPNEDEMYQHLTITINKSVVHSPKLPDIVIKLLNQVDIHTLEYRKEQRIKK
tara:strand:- start:6850 stop:7179 length:330 start_codon:yes stop_codon:yes gene_type:complete